MVWEATFENFMLSRPSCTQDEILLLKVIQFIEVIIKSIKSDRLICWTEKLLTDENQALFQILRNNGNEKTGSKVSLKNHNQIQYYCVIYHNYFWNENISLARAIFFSREENFNIVL